MGTLSLKQVRVRKAWKEAEFLEAWASELREAGDVDLLREASELERDADALRRTFNNDSQGVQ